MTRTNFQFSSNFLLRYPEVFFSLFVWKMLYFIQFFARLGAAGVDIDRTFNFLIINSHSLLSILWKFHQFCELGFSAVDNFHSFTSWKLTIFVSQREIRRKKSLLYMQNCVCFQLSSFFLFHKLCNFIYYLKNFNLLRVKGEKIFFLIYEWENKFFFIYRGEKAFWRRLERDFWLFLSGKFQKNLDFTQKEISTTLKAFQWFA